MQVEYPKDIMDRPIQINDRICYAVRSGNTGILKKATVVDMKWYTTVITNWLNGVANNYECKRAKLQVRTDTNSLVWLMHPERIVIVNGDSK